MSQCTGTGTGALADAAVFWLVCTGSRNPIVSGHDCGIFLYFFEIGDSPLYQPDLPKGNLLWLGCVEAGCMPLASQAALWHTVNDAICG
jgi:hypothetical protein